MTFKVKRSSAYVPGFNKMSLKPTAAGGDFVTKLWTPKDLGNLVEAWWEADSGVTLSTTTLIDGDMEAADTTAWTLDGATAAKRTDTPPQGTRYIRVTQTALNWGYVTQDILTAGTTYRVTGWCRSDGVLKPQVWLNSTLAFEGTTSTDWQYFDVTATCTGGIRFYLGYYLQIGSYADFDGVTIENVSRVSGWNDQKNTHNFDQPTAAWRPLVQDAVFGSAKAIRFTAANTEYLKLTGATKLSNTQAHVFIIFRLVNDPTVGSYDGFWQFGNGLSQDRMPFSGTGDFYDSFCRNDRPASGNPIADLDTGVYCYEVISTSTEWTNRLNGVQVSTTSLNVPGFGVLVDQYIGGCGGGFWMDGWVGALIICTSKLRGSNLFHMRNYLNRKYGATFT